MAESATEKRNVLADDLDMKDPDAILSLLHEGQMNAASAVAQSIPALEKAAKLLSETIFSGGNIIYAASGSSALMALADGLELPGTFGIDNTRLSVLIAGGTGSLSNMQGATEDNATSAIDDIDSVGISGNDCLICISASGTTPYTVGALEAAKKAGCKIIGIANNPQTPILDKADVAVYLQTPPEIITGSTRMGAATAQKIALNMISTLMAVHLGHVHGGHMVSVRADNSKLVRRACNIICDITRCSTRNAQLFLDKSNGSVKLAIMLASGSPEIEHAKEILERHGHKLRPSLLFLNGVSASNNKAPGGASKGENQ